MNTRHILLLIVSPFILASTLYAQAGKSGLSFLKLGISGRGVAMSDALSGTASGAEATYYNPAGLLAGSANRPVQLMFMHKEWIEDTRTEFLGASIVLNEVSAIGFSLNTTSVSDIEIRTRPGSPEGTFTSRFFSLGGSYARTLSDELRAGITAKFLYEKILIDQASGWAVDLGFRYATPVENLEVGAALANLGSMNGLREESTKLPSLLRVGPAYGVGIDQIDGRATLAAEFVHIFPEGKSYVAAGGELVLSKLVTARAGYQFGSEGRGLSTGLGIEYGLFALDYSFSPLSFDLGNSHTISLAISF
jgi:hypothetical protein